MPIHDWTKVPAGKFHDFHGTWITTLKMALTRGVLPEGYVAETEQTAVDYKGEVVTLRSEAGKPPGMTSGVGISAVLHPPQTKIHSKSLEAAQAPPTRNIAIRDDYNDELVAVIEIVSPGNKDGRAKMDAFKDKCQDLIRNGIHILIVDLFPPGRFDPLGVHQLVWDSFGPADADLQPGCDRLLASYRAGIFPDAYVEPVSVGAEMKPMALFLT